MEGEIYGNVLGNRQAGPQGGITHPVCPDLGTSPGSLQEEALLPAVTGGGLGGSYTSPWGAQQLPCLTLPCPCHPRSLRPRGNPRPRGGASPEETLLRV